MSDRSIREFTWKNVATSSALFGLVALVDAKASGKPLDPALEKHIEGLLAALGAANMLADVSEAEAKHLLPEIRHIIEADTKLLHPDTRNTSWSYRDPRLLQDIGDFSRGHVGPIKNLIVPSLDGLLSRFEKFLDIGVGVAGTAIAMAEAYPTIHITGIDVWQPSLELARANVKAAKLEGRITLREQGAESLTDEQAFDLAWIPLPFMPEKVIPKALERTRRALRPGGWLIAPFLKMDAPDPVFTAFAKLRTTIWGGGIWTPSSLGDLLTKAGFAEIRTIPLPPEAPAVFMVAQAPR